MVTVSINDVNPQKPAKAFTIRAQQSDSTGSNTT